MGSLNDKVGKVKVAYNHYENREDLFIGPDWAEFRYRVEMVCLLISFFIISALYAFEKISTVSTFFILVAVLLGVSVSAIDYMYGVETHPNKLHD